MTSLRVTNSRRTLEILLLLAVISVLASLYHVVTVALARGVLGERLARSQRLGGAGAIAGAALVAAG